MKVLSFILVELGPEEVLYIKCLHFSVVGLLDLFISWVHVDLQKYIVDENTVCLEHLFQTRI